jgi:hypothetical protein
MILMNIDLGGDFQQVILTEVTHLVTSAFFKDLTSALFTRKIILGAHFPGFTVPAKSNVTIAQRKKVEKQESGDRAKILLALCTFNMLTILPILQFPVFIDRGA